MNDDMVKLAIVVIAIVMFVVRALVGAARGGGNPPPQPAPDVEPARRPRDAQIEQEIEEFRRGGPAPPRRPRPVAPPVPPLVRSPSARGAPQNVEPMVAQVVPLTGELESLPGDAPPAPLAAGVFQLLSNPQSVQQVLVAGEIIRRPEHRWRR